MSRGCRAHMLMRTPGPATCPAAGVHACRSLPTSLPDHPCPDPIR